MSFTELVDVLIDCEASPFYGKRNLKISEKKARKEVFKLVSRSHEVHDQVIDENDNSSE